MDDDAAAAPREDAAPETPPPGTLPDVPPLSLAAAARTTGLARSTLQRRAADLLSHGAQRDEDGTWRIPVATLQALGMLDRVSGGRDTDAAPADAAPTAPADDDGAAELAAAVDRARAAEHRAELAEVRAAAAETIAAERLTHLSDLRRHVRLLESAAPSGDIDDGPELAAAEPARPPSWLSRILRPGR